MHVRTWLVTAIALLATLGTLGIFGALSTALAQSEPPAQAQGAPSKQPEDLRALDGEWLFVEDRTEGRTLEEWNPPMSSKFSMRVEEGAVILNGHGSGHKDVRIALDGSVTEVTEPKTLSIYRGTWKDSTFEYQVEFVRLTDGQRDGMIRRNFRLTADGLVVRVAPDPSSEEEWVGLYRHAQDIPLPTPAKATIADMAWLSGAWVGTRKTSGSSNEERWTEPRGGAMLAVSRTVNTKGRMSAFEYLRIVERDGGLVYIAQPGGAKGTEFVLTELVTEKGATRAAFENPHHDFPRRIVYELSAEGDLSATIGQLKGGTPNRFEWKREGGEEAPRS